MREVSEATEKIWLSGDYTGSQRPMLRATLQHPRMKLRTYSLLSQKGRSSFSRDVTDVDSDQPRIISGTGDGNGGRTLLTSGGGTSGQTIIDQVGVANRSTLKGYVATPDPTARTGARTLATGSDSNLPNGGFDGIVKIGPIKVTPPKIDIPKTPVVKPPPPATQVTQTYANYFLAANDIPIELPNLRSISWQRDVDTDVSSATITMWNTEPLPLGESPLPEQLDMPGFFTYNRGTASFSSARWKHKRNVWYAQLMPDNVIRSFEGYGFDARQPPEKDPNLYPSGVWIIDDVQMKNDGTIEVKCRDVAKILLEQLLTGPVVPDAFEPVGFKAAVPIVETINHYDTGQTILHEGVKQVPRTEVVGQRTEGGSGIRSLERVVLDSSVSAWRVGTNGEGGPGTVKDPWNYYGHSPHHANDNDPGTFWLSVGNSSPNARFAYEWVEWDVKGQDVDHVWVSTVKTGYRCYVSVMVDGRWQGGQSINYHTDGIGRNGSNIAYVAQQPVTNEMDCVIGFPLQRGAQRIRITLGNLQYWGDPKSSVHYRGAIRGVDFRCHYDDTRTVQEYKTTYSEEKYTYTEEIPPKLLYSESRILPQPAGANPGVYNDFTDIIALLLAWAGFFYDSESYRIFSDGTKQYLSPRTAMEKILGPGTGDVWADLQMTGTTGKVSLGSDGFHMKPIMDGIQVVKNILLFNFYADEEGAIQWRQANLMEVGNWFFPAKWPAVTAVDTNGAREYVNRPEPQRVQKVYTIDETQVLKTLTATITGKNVREGILTYNPAKRAGYVTPGYNPNPTGLRRMAGWPNTGYESAETLKMTGKLIATRQLQAYRKDEIVIPGFPALQIDDQVRLVERVTNEGWLHYIQGISCELNVEDGVYDYTVTTNWLGAEPGTEWWMKWEDKDVYPPTPPPVVPAPSGPSLELPKTSEDGVYRFSNVLAQKLTGKEETDFGAVPPFLPVAEGVTLYGGPVYVDEADGFRYWQCNVNSSTSKAGRFRVSACVWLPELNQWSYYKWHHLPTISNKLDAVKIQLDVRKENTETDLSQRKIEVRYYPDGASMPDEAGFTCYEFDRSITGVANRLQNNKRTHFDITTYNPSGPTGNPQADAFYNATGATYTGTYRPTALSQNANLLSSPASSSPLGDALKQSSTSTYSTYPKLPGITQDHSQNGGN